MYKLINTLALLIVLMFSAACSESQAEQTSAAAELESTSEGDVEPKAVAESKLITKLIVAAEPQTKKFSIGATPTVEEIAGWDIDVRPDGLGLPEGQGSVAQGEIIFENQCASCHGTFGEGEGRWPVLAGGFDTLTEERPEKTVGSYWPYLSTLWDYIHRAMPFLSPQSLEDDEVYAVTAYILYLNELVDEDFVLSKGNFASVKLPNEIAFVDDPRPDVQNTRCMDSCRDKDSIKITWDSTSLGVTPVGHLAATGKAEIPISDNVDSSTKTNVGKNIYQASCATCHATGVAGAPKLGDQAAWVERLKQSDELLYEHAINGFQGAAGYMPAKGGNAALTDAEVKAAVDFMKK